MTFARSLLKEITIPFVVKTEEQSEKLVGFQRKWKIMKLQ